MVSIITKPPISVLFVVFFEARNNESYCRNFLCYVFEHFNFFQLFLVKYYATHSPDFYQEGKKSIMEYQTFPYITTYSISQHITTVFRIYLLRNCNRTFFVSFSHKLASQKVSSIYFSFSQKTLLHRQSESIYTSVKDLYQFCFNDLGWLVVLSVRNNIFYTLLSFPIFF